MPIDRDIRWCRVGPISTQHRQDTVPNGATEQHAANSGHHFGTLRIDLLTDGVRSDGSFAPSLDC
jgi:hypothetical protein